MQPHTPLTQKTIVNYAVLNYKVSFCSCDDFKDDFQIPKQIRKHIKSYYAGSVMNVHLVLNHFIRVFNVFNRGAAIRMLFFETPEEHYKIMKTFLTYLETCPAIVYGVPDDIITDTIPIDEDIMTVLQSL